MVRVSTAMTAVVETIANDEVAARKVLNFEARSRHVATLAPSVPIIYIYYTYRLLTPLRTSET